MYFIGIDGGGTTSCLMAQDRQGNLFGPYYGDSTNLNTNSYVVVRETLRHLLEQFMKDTGAAVTQCAAVCIGSAGIDLPADAKRMEALLESVGLTCPCRAVNDVEIVLEGEAAGGPAVAVIAGTGSVAIGKNTDGHLHRTGGWGHLLGDEGSAYWIAREAVIQSLRSHDGRSPKTLLEPLLCKHFGCEAITGLLPLIYNQEGNKAELASAAKLVDEAAAQGDRAAIDILAQGAKDLFEMADAIYRKLGLTEETPIYLCGGLLEGSVPLRELLVKHLESLSSRVCLAGNNPCTGAIYLAQKM